MVLNSPRNTHLFTKHEIKDLLNKSRTINRSPQIDLRAALSANEFGKILIITPRKMGNAPQRNLMRRRIKSIFYEDKLYLKKFDIVVFCKKGIIDLKFSELRDYLNNQINKLR